MSANIVARAQHWRRAAYSDGTYRIFIIRFYFR